MRYGLSLPNAGEWGDAHTLAHLALLAEQSGWDGIFLEDYIVWQGNQGTPTYDPWIILAAMAMKTKRIRLGTAVTPLARRRPWKVAQECVTVDHLSNGRLILGVGLGDTISSDVSFTHFGEETQIKSRAKMLDEALEVITGLWSGKPFEYHGEYYQVNEVTVLPCPVQRPRIPIWVGGGFPLQGPTQRALRWDGSFLYKHSATGSWVDWTPEDIRMLKSMAEDQRTSSSSFDIVVGGRKEKALIRSLAEAGATWWVEYIPPDMGDLEFVRAYIQAGPLRIDRVKS
jgi:alkanesulfonate monooxygenase SsuD/methylene tetrahydromethanopterin reductase-like flavin-dependent oxidoreductase (luciferase family)